MKLSHLPDDVLLAVLGHLSARNLFSARLVCRRFRDICLHRQLWNSRVLGWGTPMGLMRAVLTLVPCLRQLNVYHGQTERLALLVPSISCSVLKLEFEESSITCDSAQDFITIVQRLSSLGGLAELDVCLALDNASSPVVHTLLKTIYTIKDLKHLFIGGEMPLPTVVSIDEEVKPSLISLNYRSLADDTDTGFPFVELLLKAHATTLEEIIIELHDVPLSSLKGSSKLRSLTIFPNEELPLLLECPKLSSIELVYSGRQAFPAGTIEFFRRAVNLRSVTFTCPKQDSSAALLALARSKSAQRVKVLDVFSTSPEDIKVMESSLHKFSSLQDLTFQSVSVTNDFLRAVDPSSTPNLTSLTIDACHDGSQCAHAWLHGPAIQDLFARNPRLGLYINEWQGNNLDCSCRWCSWGCHSDLDEPLGGFSANYI